MQVNWNDVLEWIISRAKEPTTYIGLGMLLSSAGVHVDPTLGGSLVTFGVAAAGLAGVVMSETHTKG